MKQKTIEVLKNLIETQGMYMEEYYCGLCGYLSSEVENLDGYELISDISQNWEHFSGNGNYPIPTPKDSHYRSLSNSFKLWENEQLKYRLSLAQHLLNEVEKIDSEKFNELYREDEASY